MHFKQFLKGSGALLRETYAVWFTYWWWLIGLYLLGGIYLFRPLTNLSTTLLVNGFFQDSDIWYLPALIASSLLVLLYITLFLSARPSVKQKNYAYFFSYGKQALIITAWFFIVSGLYRGYRFIIGAVLDYQRGMSGALSQIIPGALLALTVCVALLLAFYTLFFIAALVNDVSVGKALERALKIVLYNLPYCLLMAVLGVALYVLAVMGFVLLAKSSLIKTALIIAFGQMCFDLLIALPVIVAVTSNFYEQTQNSLRSK